MMSAAPRITSKAGRKGILMPRKTSGAYMTISTAPSPIVSGLTLVWRIDLTEFSASSSNPVPSAKMGLFAVAPKLPLIVAATEPNQTRKRPQNVFVRLSGCKLVIEDP